MKTPDGKEVIPMQSFVFVRRRDAGTTEAGLVLPGEHAQYLEVVESSGKWVTVAGAVIDVDLRPGDKVYLRNPRPAGVTNVGQQLFDRPSVVQSPDWGEGIGLLAIADIVAVERG